MEFIVWGAVVAVGGLILFGLLVSLRDLVLRH